MIIGIIENESLHGICMSKPKFTDGFSFTLIICEPDAEHPFISVRLYSILFKPMMLEDGVKVFVLTPFPE